MSFAKKSLLALVLAAFCTVSTFASPAPAHAEEDSNTSMYIWLGVGLVATAGLIYLMVRSPSKDDDVKALPVRPSDTELAGDKWRPRFDVSAPQSDRVVSPGAWPSLNLVTE